MTIVEIFNLVLKKYNLPSTNRVCNSKCYNEDAMLFVEQVKKYKVTAKFSKKFRSNS